MSDMIDAPGLVWVKDPIDPETGLPNGDRPTKRHHEDCWHWYHDDRGNLIGPAPYRASEEQMHTLDPCTSCAGSQSRGGSGGRTLLRETTDQCPVCHQIRSLSGACDCD
ncbi:hypothetical protein [Cellulosimicrobium sp. TH-20]|uniref:hypothetical protein n=1 Tax=Cellulosimicrobium sp. TH-20 TaxID=1980001 RepID=UPI0012F7D11C|nr:hypothetical protein [Cellulosimicrobium sp. TH-20]